MMGDKNRDNQKPDQQKRWQDVEQFREGVVPGENGPGRPRPPNFPGHRRFPPPGQNFAPDRPGSQNRPEEEMKRPNRPFPPEGMREGDKKPWPGPGPRQFQRPDPPSGQPGSKGPENRPPVPNLKNRPHGNAPAGNPQPKGPKPGQGPAPNPPHKP